MRGRAFSDGHADCNGWELLDVIDAVNYAREHYRDYMIDPEIVYFEAGSGGGGNAMAIVNKFPDFFAAATALCGISDYALWYLNDTIGEFRDEMDVWIGFPPSANLMAYRARSGLHLLQNLHIPLFISHGETDIRVPAIHSRLYVEEAGRLGKGGLIRYFELPGVGTRDHWGNATKEQLAEIARQSEENRQTNRKPITLAQQGQLLVGGYVYTKSFSVVLDSSDKVAVLDYDLDLGEFRITCDVKCGYTITVNA
jgi:predicted peptidase